MTGLGFKYGMTSLAAVTSVLVAAPAAAQTRSFNVPAQAAEKAIPIFAKQAGVQILASGKVVKGKQTRAVQGEHQVDEALAILLAGTGLKAQRGANGAIITIVSSSAAGNGSGAASSGAQQGQAVLIGSVRDHRTGAALKGARVEVVETGEATSTGDLGDFRFAKAPTGDVTLRISYLGFPEQSETVSVVGGLTNRTDIYLGAGATTEIVVIGQVSARAQALNQERTGENNSTVISGDLLGNFNGTTISDSLRRAPGVSFQQDELTGDGTNIMVRGLAPDYNQVKLNGLALPEGNGQGRSANLSNLLSDSVSEIKISKTLTAKQESAGTGGLVEIETKSPLDRPKRYFNVSADGTKRGNGFGEDYQLSGTASMRFGADSNFGISASVQFRKQDVSSYSYSTNLIPGAYLPLAPNGQPGVPEDIDPRIPFPFYEGAEVYAMDGGSFRNRVKSETTNVTLSAAWQVSDATDLRLDYVRSRRTTDTFNANYRIGPGLAGYYFQQPVPAEGGEIRNVYGDIFNEIRSASDVNYKRGETTGTDSFSFQGKSQAGALSLDYRAGYAKGSFRQPFTARFGLSSDLALDPSWLAPEAIDPATGTVVTLFGPRRDRGFPVPLLSEAGFEALRNAPLPGLFLVSVGEDQTGRSTNWNAGLDAKYAFDSSILTYVEAGFDYKRSRFRNRNSDDTFYYGVFDPDTGQLPSLPDLGLEVDYLPFANVNGNENVYRFLTEASALNLFSNLGGLVDDGYLTRIVGSDLPILDDQYTAEDALAGYVQARADIGRLEIIGGVRVDRTRVKSGFANAVYIYDENFVLDQPFYEASLEILERSKTITSYLPRLLINFRPTKNLVFRAGYYSTVARPQIRQLTSDNTITYSAAPFYGPTSSQPGLQIFRGNPALKPARTHSFDLSAEWYDEDVGAVKLGVFHKRIVNLLESNKIAGAGALDGVDLPDHPVLNNLPANVFVELYQPVNNPDVATIWGAEVAVEKRLTFLPGFLSGLGIYANYTFTKSRKSVEQVWGTSPIYDDGGALIGREPVTYVEIQPFDDSPKHSGTAGLTYSKYGFDASLYYTAQARRQNVTVANNLNLFTEAVNSLDFRGVYNFKLVGADLRLSFEALNLLKGTADAQYENSRGGTGITPKYYSNGTYLGGRSFALGLSASF